MTTAESVNAAALAAKDTQQDGTLSPSGVPAGSACPTSVLPGETGGPDGLPRGTGQDGAARAECGCPTGPGRSVGDASAHVAWHALVVEQGGPAGEVNAVTLRAARGFKTETLHAETYLDEKARKSGKRANGKLRRAARGES